MLRLVPVAPRFSRLAQMRAKKARPGLYALMLPRVLPPLGTLLCATERDALPTDSVTELVKNFSSTRGANTQV